VPDYKRDAGWENKSDISGDASIGLCVIRSNYHKNTKQESYDVNTNDVGRVLRKC
jgi:hypothetical protein